MQESQHATDEISINDLGLLLKRIFYGLVYALYKLFSFYWKHKFIILLLIGLGLGLYLIEKSFKIKNYDSKALIVQNFDAVDFLYNTVDNVEKNIGSETGKKYMQEILGDQYENLKDIEIEPINDFYNFNDVNAQNRYNFEVFSKSSDVSNNLKELSDSKYFKYHQIKFTTKDSIAAKQLVQNFLAYVNSNEHFSKYADAYHQYIEEALKENAESLNSIDSLISSYITQNRKANANLSISNNAELYRLYDQKERIMNDNFLLKTKQVDYSKIIKPVAIEYNIPSDKLLPHWILYPFVLVVLYSLVHLMNYLFKRSVRYRKASSIS